jgi:hypothetical protein
MLEGGPSPASTDTTMTIAANGHRHLLEESPDDSAPASDPRATLKHLRSEVAAALEQYGIEVETFKQFALDTWRTDDWGRSPEILAQAVVLLNEVGPQLMRLRMLLQGIGVPVDRYSMYASRRFRREHW